MYVLYVLWTLGLLQVHALPVLLVSSLMGRQLAQLVGPTARRALPILLVPSAMQVLRLMLVLAMVVQHSSTRVMA